MPPPHAPGFMRALAPPRFLAPPAAGIDISTSGVKAVRLGETPRGLVLASFAEVPLAPGAFADGDYADAAAITAAVRSAARTAGVEGANAALPEAKSYLFETKAAGTEKGAWRTAVEQQLDELVPLPPAEAAFDIVAVGLGAEEAQLAGLAFARRVVDRALAIYDEAGLTVRAFEGETFAMARALLPQSDRSTVLIVDVGKTTTKLAIVAAHVPRFTTTIGIGGHAFTLAIKKHFGVSDTEARAVKLDRGIVPTPGNEDYLAAMLSTVSAIKEEIARRLDYWQSRAAVSGHAPIERTILAGGNASVRGLPEYLAHELGVPVTLGDVFTNLAPNARETAGLTYAESLAYATSIGLALRDTPAAHAA